MSNSAFMINDLDYDNIGIIGKLPNKVKKTESTHEADVEPFLILWCIAQSKLSHNNAFFQENMRFFVL